MIGAYQMIIRHRSRSSERRRRRPLRRLLLLKVAAYKLLLRHMRNIRSIRRARRRTRRQSIITGRKGIRVPIRRIIMYQRIINPRRLLSTRLSNIERRRRRDRPRERLCRNKRTSTRKTRTVLTMRLRNLLLLLRNVLKIKVLIISFVSMKLRHARLNDERMLLMNRKRCSDLRSRHRRRRRSARIRAPQIRPIRRMRRRRTISPTGSEPSRMSRLIRIRILTTNERTTTLLRYLRLIKTMMRLRIQYFLTQKIRRCNDLNYRVLRMTTTFVSKQQTCLNTLRLLINSRSTERRLILRNGPIRINRFFNLNLRLIRVINTLTVGLVNRNNMTLLRNMTLLLLACTLFPVRIRHLRKQKRRINRTIDLCTRIRRVTLKRRAMTRISMTNSINKRTRRRNTIECLSKLRMTLQNGSVLILTVRRRTRTLIILVRRLWKRSLLIIVLLRCDQNSTYAAIQRNRTRRLILRYRILLFTLYNGRRNENTILRRNLIMTYFNRQLIRLLLYFGNDSEILRNSRTYLLNGLLLEKLIRMSRACRRNGCRCPASSYAFIIIRSFLITFYCLVVAGDGHERHLHLLISFCLSVMGYRLSFTLGHYLSRYGRRKVKLRCNTIMLKVMLRASVPEVLHCLGNLRRLNIKISTRTLRTNHLRLLLVSIIRLMTIIITLLSTINAVSFLRLTTLSRYTIRIARARHITRIDLLLLRSIGRIIKDDFIRLAKININGTRCITDGLCCRTLRTRASARNKSIILAYMTNCSILTLSATLANSEASSSAIRAFRYLNGVLDYSILTIRRLRLRLTIIMYYNLQNYFRSQLVNVL